MRIILILAALIALVWAGASQIPLGFVLADPQANAVAGAVQAALYAGLAGDAALGALVGGAIYDSLPAGTVPALYVALGPESVRDRSDATGRGADHDVTVSVVSDAAGFATAKAAAAAVSDALLAAPVPALDRGVAAHVLFRRARAVREDGGAGRRIDLTFRVRVEDDL